MSKPKKPNDGSKGSPKRAAGKKAAKPAAPAKRAGVPPKLLARLSEDEGITGGIADDEAKLLLDALKKELAKAAAGKPPADAEAAYATVVARGRRLAKVVSAWCYDGEPDEAKRLWAEAGGQGSLDAVPADDAVKAMADLLAREGLGRD